MTDILKDAAEHLDAQLKAFASRQVTYRRGVLSVGLTASVGTSILRLDGPTDRGRVERTDRDYLVTASELVLNGKVERPKPHDMIEDLLDNKRYEVLAPQGEPCWRPSDPRGVRIRIHTKAVGSVI